MTTLERAFSPTVLAPVTRTPLQDGDPRWIGRYRLTARLGSGGMGMVYLAVDPDAWNGRLIAVKVIRPELAGDPEFRARFSREAAVLGRVQGRRVVRVIEAGTDGNVPFLATEYAGGPLLSGYVESAGPLGTTMLHDLAASLAAALADIHAAGVVHRDLKPSNVILAADGPKIIDFGIAQVLDSVSLTQTGMTVGSAGFMAPEQVMGQAGPPSDVFAWALTVAYAASGQPPFGTGSTAAVMYRVLHGEPDLDAVPDTLRPVVEAALAKEPGDRPAAREILEALTAGPPAARSRGGRDAPAALVPVTRRKPGRRAAIAVSAAALAAVAALTGGLLTGGLLAGHGTPRLPASRGASSSRPLAAGPFGTYPGQQDRGVFQTISRIAASGRTIVTTGTQVSDGIVRQQFFVSADGGASWQPAQLRGADPLGYAATRLAAGPRGWVATGPGAIWTSKDGRSWTLAARHGLPGGQVYVLTGTASGFLAAGQAATPGGATQAVIWTSPDGVDWQRLTAAQAGLGASVASISYAASFGGDTVISDGTGAWLSTDGGQAWTPVRIPAGQGPIAGLAADGSGLIAVRAGTAGGGAAYFSPNGRTWQYSATLGAAGYGFTPQVVKGSAYGFVVTGTDAAGDYLAYAGDGDGASWQPTGSLGGRAAYASAPAATVAPGGAVIAAGSTVPGKTGQQAVLLRAGTAGSVRPVRVPDAVVPEVAVNSLATADGQQLAAGSADGYPAIWRKTPGGTWTLVTSLPLVSATPGLAALTSITHGSAGWLAVGAPGPVAYTSVNGTTWRPAPRITGDLAGAGGTVAEVAAAAGPAGYVITGKLIAPGGSCVADVWWSPDLTHWTRSRDVNDTAGSSQILAVAADNDGFYSAGSHDGQPAVWTTDDGRTWKTVVLPLGYGASGVLQQVAVDGDRVVALGTQTSGGVTTPLAELSANDGATWTRVPFGAAGADPAVTALTTGSGGFTAAVRSGAAVTVWTSRDGATWTPAPQRQQGFVLTRAAT